MEFVLSGDQFVLMGKNWERFWWIQSNILCNFIENQLSLSLIWWIHGICDYHFIVPCNSAVFACIICTCLHRCHFVTAILYSVRFSSGSCSLYTSTNYVPYSYKNCLRYVAVGDIAHAGNHPPNVAAVYRYSDKLFTTPVGFDLVRTIKL